MKPWDKLTDLEKREAIARRLGWEYKSKNFRVNGGDILSSKFWCLLEIPHNELPGWPTNDGLAFTEVWPRIAQHGSQFLGLLGGKPSVCEEDHGIRGVISGTTWADAICRAAYELLPDQAPWCGLLNSASIN